MINLEFHDDLLCWSVDATINQVAQQPMEDVMEVDKQSQLVKMTQAWPSWDDLTQKLQACRQ